MDHQDALHADFDRDHLKSTSRCIISKVHKPQIRVIGSANWWWLPKAKATVLDDITRLPTGYPMLGCGASPLQRGLTNSSDNNITVSGHRLTFTRCVCPNKTAR